MVKTLYVCEYCGVTDIEIKVWMNPNTNVVSDDVSDHRECFCNNCGEPSRFIMVDENEMANIVFPEAENG